MKCRAVVFRNTRVHVVFVTRRASVKLWLLSVAAPHLSALSLGSTGRPLDLWPLYFKSRTGEVWQLRSACNNWKRESSRPAGPYLKTYSSSFHRQPTPQEAFRSCGTPQDRFSVLVVWIEGLGLITLNWFFLPFCTFDLLPTLVFCDNPSLNLKLLLLLHWFTSVCFTFKTFWWA